jgi:hypothetical protein
MQSNTIQLKIKYYLKKYPDSKFTLTYGQKGAIEDDIKEFGKSKKYTFISNNEVDIASTLGLIQQIQHTQDYNKDHDKTTNIIFLFYEKQGAIRNCETDGCYNAVGEATDKDAEFCDKCEEDMDDDFWSN